MVRPGLPRRQGAVQGGDRDTRGGGEETTPGSANLIRFVDRDLRVVDELEIGDHHLQQRHGETAFALTLDFRRIPDRALGLVLHHGIPVQIAGGHARFGGQPDLDDLPVRLIDQDATGVIGGISDALTVEPDLRGIQCRGPNPQRSLFGPAGILPDEKKPHHHDDHQASDEKT